MLENPRLVPMAVLLATFGLAVIVPSWAGPRTSVTHVILQTSGQGSNHSSNITGTTASESQHSETSASSAAPAKYFDKPYGFHLEPILQKINASPDQRKRITQIVQEYKPKIEPMRIEYKQKSKEFIDFIVKGQQADLIMARQGELNSLYGAIVTEYSLMRLEIRRLLSSQQCQLFEEYRLRQGWRSK